LSALALAIVSVAVAGTPKTRMVSVAALGDPGNGNSYAASISANGRFIAFSSDASDLVPDDTLGQMDVFVRDMRTGVATRVSVRSNGAEANGASDYPSISSTGRYVAFQSGASNLVTGDTNGETDVFVHDTVTGKTERVSVDSAEAQALGGTSATASISADGSRVAFDSEATNLVVSDGNALSDIFVRDITAGTTARVSVRFNGGEVNGYSRDPWISPDGEWVVFRSVGRFGGTDVGSDNDVFIHRLSSGKTARVSVLPDGTEPDASSEAPSVSANGEFVAFVSEASDLVPDDGSGQRDVFVWTRATGEFERISVDTLGGDISDGATASGEPPTISWDGRYVAFDSGADDIVAGDGNLSRDAFVRDRELDTTIRVSLTSSGAERDATNELAVISADGRFVTFESDGKFTAGDVVDGFVDVFRRGPLF